MIRWRDEMGHPKLVKLSNGEYARRWYWKNWETGEIEIWNVTQMKSGIVDFSKFPKVVIRFFQDDGQLKM